MPLEQHVPGLGGADSQATSSSASRRDVRRRTRRRTALGPGRPVLCVLAAAITFSILSLSLAHYPFPDSQEEVERAKQIEAAVKKSNQEGVHTLIWLLRHENPRVQTAVLLALVRLSSSGLDLAAAAWRMEQLRHGGKTRISAYRRAATRVALIMASKDTSAEQKQETLIALSADEDGAARRMAVEGLKVVGDRKCLSVLEERANDSFGDHDDSFDMRAVSRVAFETWWQIKGAGLAPEQRIPTIISSLEFARPFGSRWGDAACHRLERLGRKAVPYLIEVWRSTSGNAKAWAGRTLRYVPLQDAEAKQVKAIALRDLGSRDQGTRRGSLSLLGKFLDQQDVDLLIKLLATDPDPMLRNFAVTSLGRLAGEKAIPPLLGALKDENELTRVNAARALAELGRHEGHEQLLRSFGSAEYGPRLVSLGAVELLDQGRACARILELLGTDGKPEPKEKSRSVGAIANLLEALSKMSPETLAPAKPVLKELLRHREHLVSRSAADILKKLGLTVECR